MSALALLFLLSSSAESKKLTFQDAETMALEANARQRSARALARSSHDQADIVRSHLLPSLHVNEELQHYDSPFEIAFGGDSFRARNQDTNTLSIAASQPLLGLFKLSNELSAKSEQAAAQDENVRAAENTLRETVRVGFLRYFEAVALAEVARASEQQLEAEVREAEANLKAGIATKADLLRVKVALANAKGQEIVAASQGEVARAQLLATIGLDPNEPAIELVEPAILISTKPPESASVAASVEKATHARHELKARELEATAAEDEARAGWYALLPDVDAEAAYLRVDGQVFAPKNSGFIGLRATWAPWEWGATWSARKAAEARAESARLEHEEETRQIQVEVATAISRARAAASAVTVAEEAIAGAEEAHRETAAQAKAGVATTTDLLDAQAALTQARLNFQRARYEEAIALVTLSRVTGDLGGSE